MHTLLVSIQGKIIRGGKAKKGLVLKRNTRECPLTVQLWGKPYIAALQSRRVCRKDNKFAGSGYSVGTNDKRALTEIKALLKD